MSLYAAHAGFGGKGSAFCSTAMWAAALCIRISAAEEWEYSGTPRQTASNLCLSIIKDEICHAETPHPVTGFSRHSEGLGKVAVMIEITPVRACVEARRVICTVFSLIHFISQQSGGRALFMRAVLHPNLSLVFFPFQAYLSRPSPSFPSLTHSVSPVVLRSLPHLHFLFHLLCFMYFLYVLSPFNFPHLSCLFSPLTV